MDGADTIVVGAGSAGAVIAARLTEESEQTVLLLEAGPDYATDALPDDLRDGTRNSLTAHDWGLSHDVNAQARFRFPYPRGRVVGGSSAVNTCIALRGQPYDFDEWADRGVPEWCWAACEPYFRKLERDLDFGDRPEHGRDGPLPLRRHPPEELVPWQAAFLEACREAGHPECPDSNLPGVEGAGPHAMNKLEGRRVSAAQAYLTPAVRARPHLEIRAGTLVRRVRFEGRRAVGVEVEQPTGEVTVLAARRVVLCAGAIHTPGILLRSGVGPRAELDRLGVERVSDVPAVGARLLDHPGAAFFLRPRWGAVRTADPLIQTVLRLTSDGGRTADLIVQPGSSVMTPWFSLPVCSIMCAVGKPSGHGRLVFPSADPRAAPRIESRLLDHPEDRRRAVQALSVGYDLCRSAAARAIATPLWPRPRTLKDPDRMDAWIRSSCDSGYHPAGTVPMGAEDDPDVACDSRGRVRGTEGLVVADASLMPTITSSNTNLPTLMIGERFGAWMR